MESHVALVKEAIFKCRYGLWYLIHTQNPDERTLVEDRRTVELLLELFRGDAIAEVSRRFALEEYELREFLFSLREEGLVELVESPVNSLERCHTVEPPLDSVNILITNACNLRCVHCYVDSGKRMEDELTGVEWIEVLEQARRLGAFELNVSGGEPLVHKDFRALAAYIASVPTFHANLNTNGTQIREGMEQVIANAFSSVQISIDDSIAHRHDAFRGLNGCFQKSMESIQRLTAAGVETNIGFTLTRGNLEALQGVVELCESIGVTTLNIGLVSDIGRAHKNHLVSQVSEAVLKEDPFWERMYREFRELAARPTDLRILLPFRVGNERAEATAEKCRICDGDNNQILYIMANGAMMPCDKLPAQLFGYGNVRNGSLVDAWKSKQMRAFKMMSPRDLPKCRDCPYLKICGGACVARAFHTGGSLTAADWTSCIIAQKFTAEKAAKTVLA